MPEHALDPVWLDELGELLAVPSVSADPEHAEDVRRAGELVRDHVRRAGGEAELIATDRHPLVVGEIPASRASDRAPTVLVYGHFDVQPPAPLELWDSDPFEATIREGYLYARGAVDDKGQLYMLVKAAELLARDGGLPVNVRLVSDGEEEVGGDSVIQFLRRDDRHADACVIFDGGMEEPGRPLFFVSTRGALAFDLRVRASERDLHSGLGNTVVNATHALITALGALLPRDGRLPEPLREGAKPPSDEQRASWCQLKPGHLRLAELGALPHDERAADEFHLRISSEPAIDVNGILGGKPGLLNTTVPATAQANFTIRIAPGQDPDTVSEAAERLLREAAPPGVELELVRQASAAPAEVDPHDRAIELAAGAFERVVGRRPIFVSGGGTLPVLAELCAQGIPSVGTGFGLPDAQVHSPNERLRLEYLPLGIETAKELYRAFAALG